MPPYCGGWVGVDRPLDAARPGRHTPPRMENHSPAGRVTAALLGVLLASCGTNCHLAPAALLATPTAQPEPYMEEVSP